MDDSKDMKNEAGTNAAASPSKAGKTGAVTPAAAATKRSHRNDIIVIIVVLALALGIWAVVRGGIFSGASTQTAGSAGPYAVVQNTEGEYQALPLSQDVTISVTSSYGENTIVVQGGTVRVDEADCRTRSACKQARSAA